MRNWLPVSAFLLLSSAAALGQTNIKPDTTPRVPPQAGQGLPVEDQQFVSRAMNLSEAEIEAGRLATEKASGASLKEFGQRLTAEHEKLRGSVQALAQKYGITAQPHPSRTHWQGELQRLRGLNGSEFDREYLKWQLPTHLALVNLYQVQASNTTQTDLSRFAIISLNEIQRLFGQAKELGAQQGVAINTVRQPPQY